MQEDYEDKILNGFPYPIVSRFNKLLMPDFYDASVNRLRHILATGESISRYLGIIVLCECRELAESKPETIDDFNVLLKRQLKKPSWGIWQEIIREGLKWLHRHHATPLIEELYPALFNSHQKPTDTANALNELLTIRNSLQHNKVKTTAKALCQQSDPLLSKVLEDLPFLQYYKLSFISQIEVLKHRKQDAHFRHFIGCFIGESHTPRGRPNQFDFYMEPKCTLLVNPKTQQYLNLDPFLLYEEEAGKAKDIFFLNGMVNPDNASYSACNQGGGFKACETERAEEISKELQQLLDTFTPVTSTAEVA